MHLNFDFFSIEPSTIIGVLLNTLILFLLFKHFLFAPVNKIIEERKAQVSKTYEDADAALEKAKNMETEYAEKLSAAKEHGWLRSEGKDYEVKDGDICHFLFNV